MKRESALPVKTSSKQGNESHAIPLTKEADVADLESKRGAGSRIRSRFTWKRLGRAHGWSPSWLYSHTSLCASLSRVVACWTLNSRRLQQLPGRMLCSRCTRSLEADATEIVSATSIN